MFIRILLIVLLSSGCLYSIQEDPWVLLIKKCNQEKFSIRFPQDPEFIFSTTEKSHHFFFESDGFEHHLKVRQRGGEDHVQVFQQVKEKLEFSKEHTILETSEKIRPAKSYLDIKSQILGENSKIYEVRTIITKENIYTLETFRLTGVEAGHAGFLKSFQLLKNFS